MTTAGAVMSRGAAAGGLPGPAAYAVAASWLAVRAWLNRLPVQEGLLNRHAGQIRDKTPRVSRPQIPNERGNMSKTPHATPQRGY